MSNFTSNFKGYYFKIGDCKFNSPMPKIDGYEVQPRLVQVTDAGRLASGKLLIKQLPHRPTKLTVEFPVLTQEQFNNYYKVLDNMYLRVEYFDESRNGYYTGTFYHTDLKYKPVNYMGQRMVSFEQFSLIEH